MAGYRDRQWCSLSSRCAQAECHRKITPEVHAEATAWWQSFGGKPEDGPVYQQADLSGRCGAYQPIEEEATHGAV
jgi:hypothetical protein